MATHSPRSIVNETFFSATRRRRRKPPSLRTNSLRKLLTSTANISYSNSTEQDTEAAHQPKNGAVREKTRVSRGATSRRDDTWPARQGQVFRPCGILNCRGRALGGTP